jgi:hypothetical protein
MPFAAIRDPDQRELLINGELVTTTNTFSVIDPSTGCCFAECADVSEAQTNDAVDAAAEAQPAWGALPLADRKVFIGKAKEALLKVKDELAPLLVKEQGKPLDQASSSRSCPSPPSPCVSFLVCDLVPPLPPLRKSPFLLRPLARSWAA